PDGVENSATTLTATGNNASARQIITSAEAERITSLYIKRRTGTGKIGLSQSETDGNDIVTNGDFATNDLTGWTDQSQGTGSVDASSGAAVMVGADSSANRARIVQELTVEVGKVYRLKATITSFTSGAATLVASTNAEGEEYFQSTSS